MYPITRCDRCGERFEQLRDDPVYELCDPCTEQEYEEHMRHMNREYERMKL